MEKKSAESLKGEDWFIEKLESGSGMLVETKFGNGITKNEDPDINGS